jgi:hypothetical protein
MTFIVRYARSNSDLFNFIYEPFLVILASSQKAPSRKAAAIAFSTSIATPSRNVSRRPGDPGNRLVVTQRPSHADNCRKWLSRVTRLKLLAPREKGHCDDAASDSPPFARRYHLPKHETADYDTHNDR